MVTMSKREIKYCNGKPASFASFFFWTELSYLLIPVFVSKYKYIFMSGKRKNMCEIINGSFV
jgi:hypothetical protein